MKTFVYHDGALGDVLLSLPCLARLKAASGWVYLAGRADVARFLNQAGVVDAAIPSDSSLFASLYSIVDERLRSFLSGFDYACVFTAGAQLGAASVIQKLIPRTRIIRTIPPGDTRAHAAEYRLSQLDPGVTRSGPWLRIPPARQKAAQSMLREAGCSPGDCLIAVHPGSGGKLKCWPLERYFELIERLQPMKNAFVIVFTGNAEDAGLRETVHWFVAARKKMFHAAERDLMSAAALLPHCGTYIGNDSGFSHLAGALGCRTIVLFGPTDPLVWKPLGPGVQIISAARPGLMTQIAVDDVIEKTKA